MAGIASLSYLATPYLFDQAKASVSDGRDGNVAQVNMPLDDSDFAGLLQFVANGDGANVLADGLEHLAALVRAAHNEWLKGKAAQLRSEP